MKKSMTSPKVSAANTLMPSTITASCPLSFGTIIHSMPSSLAEKAHESTPGTGRISPLRPTSPMIHTRSVSSAGIISRPHRIPTAIARSYAVPSFLKSAGDRLTVIFFAGSGTPAFRSATLTRSLASLTSAAISPTRLIPGSPLPTSTSTSTFFASIPRSAIL